jgi:hypothetical protein
MSASTVVEHDEREVAIAELIGVDAHEQRLDVRPLD